MPRRTTAFNMGTRSNYDYQFTGYQGAGNPFAQLAQTFNSGTRAEQSSTLQARHALIMGTVGNTLDLQRRQGESDIEFADSKRRAKSTMKTMRKQQDWVTKHHPDKGIVVTGVNRHGDISQTPTVSHALQQGHSQYSFQNWDATDSDSGSTPPPSGGPSGGWNPHDSSLFSDTGGASQHPFLNPTQFTPADTADTAKDDSGSGSKSPADALAGRPIEPAEGAPSGGSGTADLVEAHAGTATSTTGTGRGRRVTTVTADSSDSGSGAGSAPGTGMLSPGASPLPESASPLPESASPLPKGASPLPKGASPLPASPYSLKRDKDKES